MQLSEENANVNFSYMWNIRLKKKIGIYLIYNLVLGIQQSESVMHKHIYTIF